MGWGFKAFLSLVLVIFLTLALGKFYKLKELKVKIKQAELGVLSFTQKKAALLDEVEASKDTVWLELVLMEELGVVPEGAIRINYLEEL